MSVDRTTARASAMFGRAPERRRLLTWGLRGPRDGIDHAIRAIALLGERRRDIQYLIIGVADGLSEGDGADRGNHFTRMVWDAGVASSVRVDSAIRTPDVVAELVASASLVILCDDASGAEHRPAITATAALGRPLIATASPHTADLSTAGTGIVVPYGDPVALAAAIVTIVDDPAMLQDMADRARRLAAAHAAPRQTSPGELVSAAVRAPAF